MVVRVVNGYVSTLTFSGVGGRGHPPLFLLPADELVHQQRHQQRRHHHTHHHADDEAYVWSPVPIASTS